MPTALSVIKNIDDAVGIILYKYSDINFDYNSCLRYFRIQLTNNLINYNRYIEIDNSDHILRCLLCCKYIHSEYEFIVYTSKVIGEINIYAAKSFFKILNLEQEFLQCQIRNL